MLTIIVMSEEKTLLLRDDDQVRVVPTTDQERVSSLLVDCLDLVDPGSNLVSYAQQEIERLPPGLDYDGEAVRDALRLVKVFASQGHSGASAFSTIAIANRLLAFKPLTPLTGADDEWTDMSPENDIRLWQNKRCSTVFKEVQRVGTATHVVTYDIAKTKAKGDKDSPFKHKGALITFPYMPE